VRHIKSCFPTTPSAPGNVVRDAKVLHASAEVEKYAARPSDAFVDMGCEELPPVDLCSKPLYDAYTVAGDAVPVPWKRVRSLGTR
jgi:hypothetical protein